MELRHLHYFIAVAEELNFSRAAKRVHIAQPPLSQQIRDLETELGVTLFERTKRKVTLTDAGEVFLEEVRRIIQQVDRAVELVRKAGRGEVGRLIIGFNSSASYSILPQILHDFRVHCPDVEPQLQELTTTQQLEGLREDRLDLGLLYLPIEDDNLKTLPLIKESLIIALPETHPLSDRTEICLEMLKNELFILPTRQLGEGLYRRIISFFEQNNFIPQRVQEVVQLQTATSLVAGNVGVAIVPSSLQNLQRKGVVYQPLQETTPEITIAAAWRQNNQSPILAKFLNSIEQAISVN